MQNEIKEKVRLLNENGELINPGYAKKMLFEYHRADIKASGLRIKEWDYYYIGNQQYGIALTIADNSYMALISASILDFTVPCEKTTSYMKWFTFGSLKLPENSMFGDTTFSNNHVHMRFMNDGIARKLYCDFPKFDGNKDFHAEIELFEEPDESMVIATPFKNKPLAFYYNQKINCMRAEGTVRYGEKIYNFAKNDSFATLDWGRGVWTYDNTWFWGSLNCDIDGEAFGFNIGYGFGDTSNASENMLFYKGKAHKLDQVTFNIPKTAEGKDDFMAKWTFTSNDNRFNMDFEPAIDRYSNTDVKIICSLQNQVFGYFTGTAVLDSGEVIKIEHKLGFAEKVRNKW